MNNIITSDLRGLDLNLLLVFQALLEERSVTMVAKRLFLGQPAVSGALKRLRAAFSDELFIRTPKGMAPTARAFQLGESVQPLLRSLGQQLRNKSMFVPSTSDRVFRVGLSDSLEVVLMPQIVARIAEFAPGTKIISRFTDVKRVEAMLDAGEVELSIGVYPKCASWQRTKTLFRWDFVCIYNSRLVKTRRKKVSLEEYLRFPHVLTSFNADLRGGTDSRLDKLGVSRRVIFSSPGFATSPFIVQKIAAFATVPTFIAGEWRDALGLSVSPLPFAGPTFNVSLRWTAANDEDTGLAWLRSLFVEIYGQATRKISV